MQWLGYAAFASRGVLCTSTAFSLAARRQDHVWLPPANATLYIIIWRAWNETMASYTAYDGRTQEVILSPTCRHIAGTRCYSPVITGCTSERRRYEISDAYCVSLFHDPLTAFRILSPPPDRWYTHAVYRLDINRALEHTLFADLLMKITTSRAFIILGVQK